jgi:hypothetical protein
MGAEDGMRVGIEIEIAIGIDSFSLVSDTDSDCDRAPELLFWFR